MADDAVVDALRAMQETLHTQRGVIKTLREVLHTHALELELLNKRIRDLEVCFEDDGK